MMMMGMLFLLLEIILAVYKIDDYFSPRLKGRNIYHRIFELIVLNDKS